jgi:ornithine cyclodeaminase/alanine dehydrogenase-like protein (mu-crystallin family)
MAHSQELILLSGHDLHRLLRPQVAIEALRAAYAGLADHKGDQGRSLGFVIEDGSIHVKAGLLPGSQRVFASKVNVNLPNNGPKHGLPTIQGIVVLVDARDGRPLAMMDSIALTGMRTAATTALAASFGAKKEARTAAIIGCGGQARYQLDALRAVLPLESVRVFDLDRARAEAFATSSSTPNCAVIPTLNSRAATEHAEICVTCTTSQSPVLTEDMNLNGCFVAAIGADNPHKAEIAPGVMRRARILVDDLDACLAGGDLHHAVRAGTVTKEQVHAELADLVAGSKLGRLSSDELVIFDSTGSGVQDVAAAWAAYREAARTHIGVRFNLSGATTC